MNIGTSAGVQAVRQNRLHDIPFAFLMRKNIDFARQFAQQISTVSLGMKAQMARTGSGLDVDVRERLEADGILVAGQGECVDAVCAQIICQQRAAVGCEVYGMQIRLVLSGGHYALAGKGNCSSFAYLSFGSQGKFRYAATHIVGRIEKVLGRRKGNVAGSASVRGTAACQCKGGVLCAECKAVRCGFRTTGL